MQAQKRRREWLAIRGLEVPIHSIDERLIHAVTGDKINGLEANSILKTKKKEERLHDLKGFIWAVGSIHLLRSHLLGGIHQNANLIGEKNAIVRL